MKCDSIEKVVMYQIIIMTTLVRKIARVRSQAAHGRFSFSYGFVSDHSHVAPCEPRCAPCERINRRAKFYFRKFVRPY